MKLSLMQKKLAKLLAINARFSNTDIGHTLGISADTVEYQINKLVKKEKLGEFVTLFDYNAIGYEHYHYLIRFKDPNQFDILSIKDLPFITFINTSLGKYDIQLIVIAKTETELESHIAQIENILKENIARFNILKFVHNYKYTNLLPEFNVDVPIPKNQKNQFYSLNKENYAIFHPNINHKNINLDNMDFQIINEIISNPRISYLNIAKNIGSNHESVRYRIKKYIDNKFLMNVGFFPSHQKFEYFTVYLFLKVKNYDVKEFEKYLASNKNIFYSARLLGEYNLIIYTLGKTPQDFAYQVKEIRSFFKDKIIDIEMLFFENVEKVLHFPQKYLNQK